MCGRFTMHHDVGEVVDRFGAQSVLFDELPPRYNVAPQQAVAAVTASGPKGERLLELCRWGLVPFWAKDPSIGGKMINARAETVAEKPSFKQALAKRRCLVPADGFYEWDRAGGTRQPIHFRLKGGGGPLFAFAGLWEEWESPDGSPLRTCTLVTTTPNAIVAPYHDRMPVILRPEDEALWMDTEVRQADALLPLLAPYPEEEMECYPVSRQVNTPVNDTPDLIEPLPG
ncbi:MAG TPA: SOS response-associated peptidase [Armatimonadaceae bacterium]|nr:SOS response-associated peptidase [Armatimonadaceae bacterium]